MFTQIIVQTLMAFAMGIFSLILVYKILNEYLNRRYQLSDARNTAYGVFQTGVILSTSLILKTIVDPAISGFRLFAQSGLSSTEIFLVFLYSILYFLN